MAAKSTPSIEIQSLLRSARTDGTPITQIRGTRRLHSVAPFGEALLDDFEEAGARCLFWRSKHPGDLRLLLHGTYRMTTASAGGWLFLARDESQPSYWLPTLPTGRRVDDRGRILEEIACPIHAFEVGDTGLEVGLSPPPGSVLDLAVWEIDPAARDLCSDLARAEAEERRPVFLWGSHGTYRIPADLYRHLVHGSVFDLRFSWPRKRRSYSENEAHALHLTLRNRELSSGKSLYRRLRDQVLLSVLARQEADGAWRHGIWTAGMECHFRLHCSALHMLMDCYCERPDESVLSALRAGTEFVAAQATEVMGETWFLHDSLERSEAAIAQALPAWTPCSNPIKSSANTLVLNTQIDTLLALHRFGAITGSKRFADRVSSARGLLERLLSTRPADRLYRLLMGPLYLTLLPTARARALGVHKRALKRLAAEKLLPWLTRLKCRKPRFVMPEGYLDRAINIGGFPTPYHCINFMDLVRYRRAFPESAGLDEIVDGAIAFVKAYDLLQHWSESGRKGYAIGFWVEGLYQLCLLRNDPSLRHLLAKSAIFAERKGVGLPPSLAGNNLESLPAESPHPCPAPPHEGLRVINLSRAGLREYLIVNPGECEIALELGTSPWHKYAWTADEVAGSVTAEPPARIAPGGWLLCREPSIGDESAQAEP